MQVLQAGKTIEPKPWWTTINADCLSDSSSPPPLAWSPMGKTSTTSSPDASKELWDPPETPCTPSIGGSRIEIGTPLTPPTRRTMKPVSLVKRLHSLAGEDKKRHKTEAGITRPSNEQHEGKETARDEDCFGPWKLVRNLTMELQAISNATAAAAAQERYCLEPSFNFSVSSGGPVPSERVLEADTRNGPKSGNMSFRIKVNNIEVNNTAVKVTTKVSAPTVSSRMSDQQVLERMIPLDIHARLKSEPYRCVASLVKDPQRRCIRNAQGSLRCLDKSFQKLSRYHNEARYSALIDEMEKLVDAVTCRSHRKVTQSAAKSDPSTTRMRSLVFHLSHARNQKHSELTRWINAISDPDLPSDAHHDAACDMKPATNPSSTPRRTVRLSPPKSNSTAVAPTAIPCRFKLSPYQPKWTSKLSEQEALLSIISTPLKPTEKKDGFIYIFWEEGNFGQVKIGYTSDLDKRLRSWNQACKRTFTYHKSTANGELGKIPHVSRIERLIHIELKKFRKAGKCEECNSIHREWFGVTEKQAVQVFRKWQKWISQEPYALDPKSGEWRIRPEMLPSLPQVCKPVELESAQRVSVPRRRSEGIKTKGRPARQTRRKTT
ncbi:DUF1766-domain-containing protein [Decorospora gaudefroyi]|uniref:DUF1766-domain-containing protein n=1 Tax=Decorospora gaudefroyi TaxID=184978 RepID=A0A6A5KF15_9PLEO|nr:DUF1766-domain-containing protein [Decorospora gaudefroyi]